MEQIERIRKMEEIMDRVQNAVKQCQDALQNFADLEDEIDELNTYYMDGAWREDYEADEKGKIPKDLKRGVLSQDTLFDLLEETDRLQNAIRIMDEDE
ncbi:MAG: DUF4298 domain-containing protein [Erysipelotrichaceae bacterium]|jgi:hypothetical protein|nr:DUF4298 domain-containing protein [Erysipelotrichaceae bacterium]